MFVYAGEKDYERSVATLPASTVNESLTNTLTCRDVYSTEVEVEVASSKGGAKAERHKLSCRR
jgi:hypothetical protein